MKIAIFSDIHMGDGSVRDDFKRRCYLNNDDNLFIMELLEKKPDVELIVSLGDMLDIARFGFEPILKANARVIEFLAEQNFVYIIGNHDVALRDQRLRSKLPPKWLFAENLIIKDTLFMHGNLFDPFCSGKFAWIGWRAIELSNIIGRHFPRFEDWLARFGGWLVGTGRNSGHTTDEIAINFIRNYKFSRGGKQFRPIKRLCMGHTHRAKELEFEPGRFYINAGSWTYRNDAILVLKI